MRTRFIIIYITMLLSWVTFAQAKSMSLETTPTMQNRISVIVEGNGSDIILIPGLASSHEVWLNLADSLKLEHRLHFVQIAGFAGLPAFAKPDGQVATPTAEAIANYILRENIKDPVIIGHWVGDFEVDTIIGGNRKQALVSIVERKTGFALIKRVHQKTAHAVKDTIIDLLKPIKPRVKTITSDNGLEFAEHQAIASSLGCRYYFAHPYSSWERGSNENLNGLIRQYFPKKMLFDSISDEEIEAVENRLNHRPRKRLKYKTPYEAFFKLDSHLDVECRSQITTQTYTIYQSF